MSEIKAGDVVRLKSGGPDMTVGSVGYDSALAYWANEDGGIDSAMFGVKTLDKVRGDEDLLISVSVDLDPLRKQLAEAGELIKAAADDWSAAIDGALFGRRKN